MTDIFISYSHEDRPRAQVLAQTLEGQRWSIFWDRTIPIGKTWRETIGKELGNARCVIVLWSKTSIESGWVQEEADDAKRRGILVPVLIENVQPPIGFRSIQTADLVNWGATEPSEAFRRLIFDIAALIGAPPKEAERKEDERKRAESQAKLEAEARQQAEAAQARRKAEKKEKENKKRPPSDQPSPQAQGPPTPEQREQSEHAPSEQPKTEEPRGWSRQTILIVGAVAVVLLAMATVPFIMRESPSGLANPQAGASYNAAVIENAAAKGDASAMYKLGVLYENGSGVTKDYAKAREWYEKGAAKGDTDAMTNLAMLYYNGYGVAKDPAKANELMNKANDIAMRAIRDINRCGAPGCAPGASN